MQNAGVDVTSAVLWYVGNTRSLGQGPTMVQVEGDTGELNKLSVRSRSQHTGAGGLI